MQRAIVRGAAVLVSVFLIVACGDDEPDGPDTGELVVSASSAPPPSTSAALSAAVDPALWNIGLYNFNISSNTDCSGPYVTPFDNGSTPAVYDFTTDPELFRADAVPTGSYPCIALRVSDVVSFRPASNDGACVAGTTYQADFHREGNEPIPFRDLSGATITATGTRTMPSDDRVYVFFSTDPAAVLARGYSPSQVGSLTGALVVPGATTFYWDGTDSVVDDGGICWIEPGTQGFR